ncbi:MAG: hypothetical protein AAGC81_06920, partial [Pseudomonadota bacterium]
MALNPITSQNTLTSTQELRLRQADRQNEAGRILAEEVGKLPMNARKNGHTKVIAYNIANFLTLGFLGQIGKACANSACMGTSNPKNWGEAWSRDLGQTYLNANQDTGKFMSFMNKAWTEGIPRLLIVGFGFNFPKENYKGDFNSPKTVHELGQLQKAREPIWGKVDKELQKISGDQDQNTVNDAVTQAVLHGSDELKALFDRHVRNELSAENALLFSWSHSVIEKTDPENPRHDPNFQMSKAEAAEAALVFIDNDGDLPVNCSGRNRTVAMKAIATAFGVDPNDPSTLKDSKFIATYQLTKNEIKDADEAIKLLQSKEPESDLHKQEIAQDIAKQVKIKEAAQGNLAALQKETFSVNVTKNVAEGIAGIDKDVLSNLGDSMTRFKSIVADKIGAGQGYSPRMENHLRHQLYEARDSFRDDLKNAGVPASSAEAIARDAFDTTAGLPTKKLMKRGLVADTLQRLETQTKAVTSVADRWVKAIDDKKEQVTNDLIEKGMSETSAKKLASEWLDPQKGSVPMSHTLVQSGTNPSKKAVQNQVAKAFDNEMAQLDETLAKKIDGPEVKTAIEAQSVLSELVDDLEDIKDVLTTFLDASDSSDLEPVDTEVRNIAA